MALFSQHCSPKSEKMQRAVDKLITLLTKVFFLAMKSGSVRQSRGLHPRCSKEAPLTENLMLNRHCAGDAWRAQFLHKDVATRTWSLTASGVVSALALDKALRKLAVSSDHLPPTSAARTTSASSIPSYLWISPFSFVPLQHRCGRPPSSVHFHPA